MSRKSRMLPITISASLELAPRPTERLIERFEPSHIESDPDRRRSGRAMAINTCAKSAQIRQSRASFASTNVEPASLPRMLADDVEKASTDSHPGTGTAQPRGLATQS